MEQKSSNYGGVRPNSGRKPLTLEQRQEKAEAKRMIMLEELLFPAVTTALKAETKGYEKELEVALSAKQIEMAYGAEALAEWKTYFKLAKPGGIDTNKTSYVSRWKLNMNKFFMLQRLLKSVGKDIENLPDVFFPPQAMLDRVNAVLARRDKKRLKKMEVIWQDTELRTHMAMGGTREEVLDFLQVDAEQLVG